MDKAALAHGLTLKTDKAIKAWAQSAQNFAGIKAEDAIKELNAEKARIAKATIVTKLVADLAGIKVPASLLKLAKANPDSRIVVKLEGDSATFTIGSKGSKGSNKPRDTAEGISPNSRINVANAVKAGNKAGDSINMDTIRAKAKAEKITQTAILFRDYPNSASVKKMKDYGYSV